MRLQCVIGVAAPLTPVNCAYGPWSAWSTCTNNAMTRTRTVTQQAMNGGTPCTDAAETVPCNGEWTQL